MCMRTYLLYNQEKTAKKIDFWVIPVQIQLIDGDTETSGLVAYISDVTEYVAQAYPQCLKHLTSRCANIPISNYNNLYLFNT